MRQKQFLKLGLPVVRGPIGVNIEICCLPRDVRAECPANLVPDDSRLYWYRPVQLPGSPFPPVINTGVECNLFPKIRRFFFVQAYARSPRL